MFHVKHNCQNMNQVSRETSNKLNQVFQTNKTKLGEYADLLLWWNQKMNLVSRKSNKQQILEYIRHSLAPLALGITFSKEELILDTGTGGGLPGIPLAIALADCNFVLNDISDKKCLVLSQIVNKLKLVNCDVKPSDLGKLAIDNPCTLISSHAFKLKNIISKAEYINWERAIIYKGQDYQRELEDVDSKIIDAQAFDLSSLKPSQFYLDKYILLVKKK